LYGCSKHKLRPENARANLVIDPDYYGGLEAAKNKQPKALGFSYISPEIEHRSKSCN
jgi:hypothetical protein